MNKKAIILSLLFLSICMTHLQLQVNIANATMNNSVRIPEESIRLRILANSNSQQDQIVKRLIRDEVNKEITKWVGTLQSINQARGIIQKHLPEIKKIVAEKLSEQNIKTDFSVQFDEVAFPTKMYGNYIYPAGEYEAVLITLGKGLGENWCALFPPLCFLDFENSDAVVSNGEKQTSNTKVKAQVSVHTQNSEQIKVKFFIVEWIDRVIEMVKSWFS